MGMVFDAGRSLPSPHPHAANSISPPGLQKTRREPGAVVVEVVERPAFLRMNREWNALVERTSDEPFYRHEYLLSWMDSFVPGANLKVLAARDDAGRLVAALPLVADRGLMYGLPVRRLVSPTSLHSARFDLIATDRLAASRAFVRTLAADRTWDVIRISEVPAGGNAWDLYHAAAEAGFPAGAWESNQSPFIPLPASHGQLEARLSSKFKANLRRRRKRLEERGPVTVERVAGGAALQSALDDLFALERSGWKGRKRTAAAQSAKTLGFYTRLAHSAARGEYLSLCLLKLSGRTIAAQYGLTRRRVRSLMMTCYDEAYRELSPGQLLMEDVLKDCIADRLERFDFLGCDGAWKLDWSPNLRAHHWFFILRDNTMGRTLLKAKFGWIPAMKENLRKWKTRLAAGGGTGAVTTLGPDGPLWI